MMTNCLYDIWGEIIGIQSLCRWDTKMTYKICAILVLSCVNYLYLFANHIYAAVKL